MELLPFFIEKDKNYIFYPGNRELEGLLNGKKINLFGHNYFYGNLEEIEDFIKVFPEKYRDLSLKFLEDFLNPPDFFSVKDKKFDLKRLNIIGILNVTPDSFSDGGLYFEKDKAVERGIKLEEEGADILDIGGQSTRPGSEEISEEEELKRVIPVLEKLTKRIKIPISIDTTRAKVAEEAFYAGASILNDISALHFDEKMEGFLEKWKPSVILMHIKGKPKDMQENPRYDHLPLEILSFLKEGLDRAKKCGLEKEKILVDPGIGFGKTFEDNLWIINNLSFLKVLGAGILIGTSRKSFIGKIMGGRPDERVYGTLASNLISFRKGAGFLRVHDVKAHRDFFKVLEHIENAKLV
ncbi:MAG: dihydropteroate synthase [Thermoanaerobaculia bacterium]